MPPYDELVIVANREKIADKRLPRFLEAVERGTLYLINHPDKSWKLFVKANPELDDELNRRAWRDTLPRFAHSPAALDDRRYVRFAEFLKQRELIAVGAEAGGIRGRAEVGPKQAATMTLCRMLACAAVFDHSALPQYGAA